MDVSGECSSGCESGWTLYLEHSNRNHNFVEYKQHHQECYYDYAEEDEEDLSMVSDASSGPPHFIEDDQQQSSKQADVVTTTLACVKSQKRKKDQQQKQSFLDDTASSHVVTFSSKKNYGVKNKQGSIESVLDYNNQALSGNYVQGSSGFQHHFGSGRNHIQTNQLRWNV